MRSRDAPIDVERFRDRTGIETDEAYRLLADVRVRATLRVLRENEAVTLEQLTEAVLRAEGRHRADVVRIHLVHVTLPRLEEYGVFDCDRWECRIVVERGLSGETCAEAVVASDRS